MRFSPKTIIPFSALVISSIFATAGHAESAEPVVNEPTNGDHNYSPYSVNYDTEYGVLATLTQKLYDNTIHYADINLQVYVMEPPKLEITDAVNEEILGPMKELGEAFQGHGKAHFSFLIDLLDDLPRHSKIRFQVVGTDTDHLRYLELQKIDGLNFAWSMNDTADVVNLGDSPFDPFLIEEIVGDFLTHEKNRMAQENKLKKDSIREKYKNLGL